MAVLHFQGGSATLGVMVVLHVRPLAFTGRWFALAVLGGSTLRFPRRPFVAGFAPHFAPKLWATCSVPVGVKACGNLGALGAPGHKPVSTGTGAETGGSAWGEHVDQRG